MALHPRAAQLLAAVLLCAAWLAPSFASAHTGHAHHAPAPATIKAPVAPATAEQTNPTAAAAVARIEQVRAAPASGDRSDGGCATHCCGGTAGMTCCAAALVPEVSPALPFTSSQMFRFARAGALLGLPPEALAKPPKSLA